MQRGLIEPLFNQELEPGQAAQHALSVTHPFNKDVALPQQLIHNINAACSRPQEVNDRRYELLRLWKARAEELVPGSLAELAAIPGQYLRRLLRGFPDDQTPCWASSFMFNCGGKWPQPATARIRSWSTSSWSE